MNQTCHTKVYHQMSHLTTKGNTIRAINVKCSCTIIMFFFFFLFITTTIPNFFSFAVLLRKHCSYTVLTMLTLLNLAASSHVACKIVSHIHFYVQVVFETHDPSDCEKLISSSATFIVLVCSEICGISPGQPTSSSWHDNQQQLILPVFERLCEMLKHLVMTNAGSVGLINHYTKLHQLNWNHT